MMVDCTSYTIEIERITYEGETCFQARVLEFPHMYDYGDTYEDAYELAIDSIATTTCEALADGGEGEMIKLLPAMKFKVESEQHSKQLQEKLFEIGYKWLTTGCTVTYTDKPVIVAGKTGLIQYADDVSKFDEEDNYQRCTFNDGTLICSKIDWGIH